MLDQYILSLMYLEIRQPQDEINSHAARDDKSIVMSTDNDDDDDDQNDDDGEYSPQLQKQKLFTIMDAIALQRICKSIIRSGSISVQRITNALEATKLVHLF